MRCREVQSRIVANAIDPDVTAHCQDCPNCAAFLRAARAVQGELDGLPADDTTVSLDSVRRQVNSRLSSQSRWELIMTDVKEQLSRRPKTAISIGLAAAVLAFCTLVPLSYDQTVGYNLAVCCVDQPDDAFKEALQANLAASGYGEASVEFAKATEAYRLKVNNLPTRSAAEHYEMALALLVSDDSDAEIDSTTRRKAVTLYDEAVKQYGEKRYKLYKPAPMVLRLGFEEAIVINGTNIRDLLFSTYKSDDELAEELRDIYAEDDPDHWDLTVKVRTYPDSHERIIAIGLEGEDPDSIDLDEYLAVGISLNDIYLKVTDESGRHLNTDSAAVEIVIPDKDRSIKGKGMLLRVHLPEEDK